MSSRLSRLLQGPHEHVWKQFALDVGGEYIDDPSEREQSVAFRLSGLPVLLERDVTLVGTGKVFVPVVSTRLSVELPAVPAYRFSMTAAGFGSSVARWFGAQDIAVGESVFDDAFVLKGVDPAVVRELFADDELRALCVAGFTGRLQRRDDVVFGIDMTPGKDPFELTMPGLVDDLSLLHRSCDVFSRVLARFPDVGTGGAQAT